MELYFSTGTTRGKTSTEVAEYLITNGVSRVELSGGEHNKSFLMDCRRLLKSDSADILLHNYSPVPRVPFSLNLASKNGEIQTKSVRLAKRAIQLSRDLGGRHYAVHAGFLFDPSPGQLGKAIDQTSLDDRQDSLSRFVDALIELREFGEAHGVSVLFENNPLSDANFKNFGVNPFLAVDIDEILEIASLSGVNLLLDVGHLKASSHLFSEITSRDPLMHLASVTSALHLSDNDGKEDQHLAFDENFWFFEMLDLFDNSCPTTLEISWSSLEDVHAALDLTSRRLKSK